MERCYVNERVEPVAMLLLWGAMGTGGRCGCPVGQAQRAECFSESALGQQRTSHRKNDRGVETTQRNERRGSKARCCDSPGRGRQVVRATER